jgi:hypothetical protein
MTTRTTTRKPEEARRRDFRGSRSRHIEFGEVRPFRLLRWRASVSSTECEWVNESSFFAMKVRPVPVEAESGRIAIG